MVSVSTWFRYIANKLDYSVSLSYKVPSLSPPIFFLAFSNDFISCFNECLWVFSFILCFDDFLPCIWFLGFGGSFACVNAQTLLERFLFAWWVFCSVDLDQGFTGDGIFQCHFSFIFLWFALLWRLSFVSWLLFHSDLRAPCLLLIRNICSGLVYLVPMSMFVGTMLWLGSLIMILCCSDENCAWFLLLNEKVLKLGKICI